MTRKEYERAWYLKNKDRRKAQMAAWRLNFPKIEQNAWRRRLYGLSTEAFEAMRAGQGNCCAICHEEFQKTPSVDHCHKTGVVRGLLCQGCNIKVGAVESPLLPAIQAYLAARPPKEM